MGRKRRYSSEGTYVKPTNLSCTEAPRLLGLEEGVSRAGSLVNSGSKYEVSMALFRFGFHGALIFFSSSS